MLHNNNCDLIMWSRQAWMKQDLHISPTQVLAAFKCFLYSRMIFDIVIMTMLCYSFRHLQLIKLMFFALRHVSRRVEHSGASRRVCKQVSANNRSHHFSKANLRPWVACGALSPSPSARTALIYIGGKQTDLHRQDHRNVTIAKGAECREKRGGLKETEGFKVNIIKEDLRSPRF